MCLCVCVCVRACGRVRVCACVRVRQAWSRPGPGVEPDFARGVDAEGKAVNVQRSRRGADFARGFDVEGGNVSQAWNRPGPGAEPTRAGVESASALSHHAPWRNTVAHLSPQTLKSQFLVVLSSQKSDEKSI